MERAKLKESAKRSLRGNYTPLILSLLVFLIVGLLGNILDLLYDVHYLSVMFITFISVLCMMGFVNSVMKVSRGEKTTVENIFSKSSLGLKYVVLTLIVSAIVLFLSLLLVVAYKSMATILLNMGNMNSLLFIFLVIIGSLLTISIFVFMIYLCISFSQIYFILNDEPEAKIGDILGKSFDMLDGYHLEYLMLELSFLGWLVLGIFTFGILYLWVIPYMAVTLAKYYDKLKENYSYYEDLTEEEEIALIEESEKKKKIEALASAKPKTTKKMASSKTTSKAKSTSSSKKTVSPSTKKESKPATKTAKKASTTKAAIKPKTTTKTSTAKTTSKTSTKPKTTKKTSTKTSTTKK